jgi:peptide/nickel transport system substrate-binding protein
MIPRSTRSNNADTARYKPRARGRTATVSVAIIAAGIVVGSCSNTRPAASEAPSTPLRVGVAQSVASATNPAQGLRQLSQLLSLEQFVRAGEDGRFEPGLADKWSLGSDGRSLLLTLRPGVKFHDGSPLDAKTIAALLPGGFRSFWGSLADEVEDVKAVAENTIEVRFRRPSPFLREMLEVTIRKPGASIIGTGPFMTTPNSTTTLRANADYYLGAPRVSEVQVSSFPEVRTAWAELLRNRIDMLYEVGADAFDSLQSSTSVALFTYTRHYQFIIAFNPQTPALRSSSIRRALNLAVDRVEVVRRALNEHGVPSSGPMWPRYWALPVPLPIFQFDPSAAAATLIGGRAGNRSAAVRFTCLVPSDAIYERISLEVKRQLQAVGVEMDVQGVTQDQLYEALTKRKFDAILTEGISGPTALRLQFLWDSRGAGNQGGFGNPTLDRAFDRIKSAENETSYREAVGALQQAFLDDPPAIFLAWGERARAVSKRFLVPPLEPGRDVLGTMRLWTPREDERFTDRN